MWGAYCCLVSANTEYKLNIFTFVDYKKPPVETHEDNCTK